MAIEFDPSQPFQVVEGETLDTLTAPRVRRPTVAVPAPAPMPIFNPSLPFTPVAESPAGPTFDPSQPVIKMYGLEEFTAKPAAELIADKDFMPIEFGKQFETGLDPAQRTKLEQVYAARESSGTSVADKVRSAFTGIFPAIKTLGEGVKSAAKLAQKFTPVGIAKRAIEQSPQDVINDYAKSATEAAASVELAALGSTDLIRRSTRAVGEAVGLLPGDLPALAAASGVPVRKAKADMTEQDWRTRLSDDIAAARQVEIAGQGNGAVMQGLGIDAATLEKDFGIRVDPEEISRLSVVTDPINYIPLGATVGWVGKLGGKFTRGAIAATRTTEQAQRLATILNTATAAASAARSAGEQVAGAVAKTVGATIEAAGNVAEKGVRALGGTASGVGLGGILGGNVYTALGGAAIAKGIPRVTQAAGRAVSGAGKILTGEAAAPAALTLAGDTLRAGVTGGLKGAAEGGVLILPFEIGARPEEEGQLLGMVGLGAVTRAGAEGVLPGARATGRAAQNKLAESIFRRVEQEPLPESPTYGTDPLLDSTHAANVSKLAPSEQKLVSWGRELLRAAGGEVYVLDAPAFNRETGSKTAHGYAVNIGEKIAPDGSATPVFRIFLNQSAEAMPHEFFHALTDLDPKRAAAFRDTVKASLTPDQLKSFEQLYNSRLNNGLPEVQWKRRLTPEQVANEAAAETFSRLFLAQDLTGVEPKVQQKAALFVSSLLEKLGAPLGKVGAKAGEAGVSTLGVRPGAESAKIGQAWVQNLVKRVNDDGTLGQPPIAPERPAVQTPIPADVVRAKPATVPPAPVPTPQPTVPTPITVNPPLPAAPTVRNIRTTRAAQDDFAGQRAAVTNIDPARAAAAATGDANTIARVDEISALIESGSPVVEIEHSGARAEGTAAGRTVRRAEQEAAYIAEGMANAPSSIREAYQKVLVPVRWEVVGGKPQLLAMSLDKVIANTHKAVKEAAARGVAERVPYEIADGKLTDNAWGQFVDDLKSYADNQSNGYRGDGQKLARPTTNVGLSIPAENPAYNPRPITEERANFLNLVQGLNPPLTAREGRQSSAIVPGNVKGQILAEANLRTPERPSVIRPEDITKQDFKSQSGRSIAETNPLRNELAAAGVPVRELIEVTERINARDINSVRPRPELEFRAPVTDTIRGGFLPAENFSAKADPITEAAIETKSGKIFSGSWHGEAMDKWADAEQGGGDPANLKRDGFLTVSGKFLDRKEALSHAESIGQLRPGSDSAFRGSLESETFNKDLTRQKIDDFRAGNLLPGEPVESRTESGRKLEERGFSLEQTVDGGLLTLRAIKDGKSEAEMIYSSGTGSSPVAEFVSLDVAPDLRKQGIGEALIREAAADLQVRGIERVISTPLHRTSFDMLKRVFGKFEFVGDDIRRIPVREARQMLPKLPDKDFQSPPKKVEVANRIDPAANFLPGDTASAIAEVLKMDATAFNTAARSWDGGQRNRAYDLGLSTKSIEEVQLLKDAQSSASADRKRFMAEKDVDNGVASALKAQFFREAYEAATDTGGAAGEIGWRQVFPDRQSPFPETKSDGSLEKRLAGDYLPDGSLRDLLDQSPPRHVKRPSIISLVGTGFESHRELVDNLSSPIGSPDAIKGATRAAILNYGDSSSRRGEENTFLAELYKAANLMDNPDDVTLQGELEIRLQEAGQGLEHYVQILNKVKNSVRWDNGFYRERTPFERLGNSVRNFFAELVGPKPSPSSPLVEVPSRLKELNWPAIVDGLLENNPGLKVEAPRSLYDVISQDLSRGNPPPVEKLNPTEAAAFRTLWKEAERQLAFPAEERTGGRVTPGDFGGSNTGFTPPSGGFEPPRGWFPGKDDSNGSGAGAFLPGIETEKALKTGQIKDPRPSVPEPDETIRGVAAKYVTSAGIESAPHQAYDEVDTDLATRLATFYEAAKDSPTDPTVQASYQALVDETLAQYQAIKKAGYTIEAFEGDGEPYKSSAEMVADVRDNKHLFVLPTEGNFAGAASNPLLQPGPDGFVVNDVFRAVHDFFGHAKEGYQFGPRGEFNAWKAHAPMFSETAQGSLAAETLAQNSWVNYGPNRDLPLRERPFAEQKNVIVPDELIAEARGDFLPGPEKPMPGSIEEYDARVPRKGVFPTAKRRVKSSKQSSANPTAWILPNGKIEPLTTAAHEHELAKRKDFFNKEFGTKFTAEVDNRDRLDALNKGFVRMRYTPNGGGMRVELNSKFWSKQKQTILKTLLGHSSKIDKLSIELVNDKGHSKAHADNRALWEADNREAAIEEVVNEVVPPKVTQAEGVGPSDIQRMRALPGEGDFLPGDSGSFQPRYISAPDGLPDVLDAIHELGGIRSPKKAKNPLGGEYDGYAESFGIGVARLLRKDTSGRGLPPDELRDSLVENYGFRRLENINDLYSMVERATKRRKALGQFAVDEWLNQEPF